MPMPTVSVLINNYNNAPWLRECVDSALTQTRPADEVIVFDDGSTDDSLEILRGYGKRVRLIEGGIREKPISIVCQAEAVARAFAASSGDCVFLLDGDDCYLPRRIELALQAWELRLEANLVQGPKIEIDEAGRKIMEVREPRPAGDRYLEAILASNEVEWFYPTSMQSFRRDFLARHLPLELPNRLDCAMDIRLAFLAALSPGGVACHDEAATLYRVRRHSMSELTGLNGLSRRDYNRMHMECFNRYAKEAGCPGIVPWKNRRYLLQFARQYLPEGLGTRLASWKAGRALERRRRNDRRGDAR
jgi:glycosyltransferase involved in cell wall biosynthesis